ncbi:hypothetical protein T440DRAFT_468820 [Plenodomus tracheiphilus IPT5]|uniref:Uncharacterized protein n=1 Tax=Plenodomus tracheiphilus IPT5 TaxID=1408161 RepID=A0A6A7B610_9PLEO|nr:hypothetical protein T440DRAFT_468820 [Plenodomus tracheiphilus IPT5]
MDVDKCVTLHNRILQLGWSGSGRTNEEFGQDCKTWFDYFGPDAEALRDVLSTDLVAFLERAYVTDDTHSFFYYVGSLHHPSNILAAADFIKEVWSEDDETRYLVLYAMNMFGSHPVGLIFDQKNYSAIICGSIDDCETICNGRIAWHPLETVLEAWLDMIEKGKIVVTVGGGGEGFPWKLVPYSERILQDTVDVFNMLVEEIESRLPQDGIRVGQAVPPLVEDTILDTVDTRRGFAYQLAQRIKRPRFQYIAPGLEVPTSSSIVEQPFASLLPGADRPSNGDVSPEQIETFPILLFRATDDATSCKAPASGDDSIFCAPYDQVGEYPAGLYLSCTTPSYINAFEDECKLVLPFRVGAQGYARTGDGARFGENREDADQAIAQDTFADVYQPGYQPFTVGHPVQIFRVLTNWLAMVQGGHWKVDANGVVGGIEEWKKVDTEDSWEKYVIPITW